MLRRCGRWRRSGITRSPLNVTPLHLKGPGAKAGLLRGAGREDPPSSGPRILQRSGGSRRGRFRATSRRGRATRETLIRFDLSLFSSSHQPNDLFSGLYEDDIAGLRSCGSPFRSHKTRDARLRRRILEKFRRHVAKNPHGTAVTMTSRDGRSRGIGGCSTYSRESRRDVYEPPFPVCFSAESRKVPENSRRLVAITSGQRVSALRRPNSV